MRISDWSSDVCSSDLSRVEVAGRRGPRAGADEGGEGDAGGGGGLDGESGGRADRDDGGEAGRPGLLPDPAAGPAADAEGGAGGGQRAVEEQPPYPLADGLDAAHVLAREMRLPDPLAVACAVSRSGGAEKVPLAL